MKYKLLLTILCFIITSLGFTGNVYAAKLYLSPSTVNVNNGQSGQITVYVDTEGKNSFGVDGVLNISGSSVNFIDIIPAGNINSSELSKELGDSQLKFRISTFDALITGVEKLATITYTASANGTTTLSFVSGQNFDTSSVAEDITGAELLTSTGNATFNVGTGGVVTAVCGNGVVEGTEQCEASIANSCPGGYTWTASCVCIFGTQTPTQTQTPIITSTPINTPTGTGTITIPTGTPTGGSGTIIPSSTVKIPTGLPKSAIESEDLKIFLTSTTIVFIGLALFALFSVPEFNLELIGTKLKISYYSSKKRFATKSEVDRRKDKFESGF